MKIRVQPILGAWPLMCTSNVQKRIKAMGGRAIYGWQIRDLPDEPVLHMAKHCVWESPDGELVDVTPIPVEMTSEGVVSEFPEETEFERDDSITEHDDFQVGRYAPRMDDPHLARACRYMEKADQKLWKDQDLAECRRLTRLANTERRLAGLDGHWPVPKSLDIDDIARTFVGLQQETAEPRGKTPKDRHEERKRLRKKAKRKARH